MTPLTRKEIEDCEEVIIVSVEGTSQAPAITTTRQCKAYLYKLASLMNETPKSDVEVDALNDLIGALQPKVNTFLKENELAYQTDEDGMITICKKPDIN